jgi:hypothetical protein
MGVNVDAKYPENVLEGLSDDDILTLFTTHALGGEAGILSMTMQRINVVSYYTGKPKDETESQFIVALFLSEGEEPKKYEEYLLTISENLIRTSGMDGFMDFFVDCYEAAITNPSITEEQIFATILRDEINQFILELLREGPITKFELAKYLSKELNRRITEVDPYLAPFVRNKFIEHYAISEGGRVTSEYIFLIKDIDVLRSPTLNIAINLYYYKTESQIRLNFQKALDDFFSKYEPSPNDKDLLVDFLSNPGTYEIIRILRQGFVKSDELISRMGFEMRNIYNNLERLGNSNIVVPIKDEYGQIWLFLLCDIHAVSIFPEFMVDTINKSWDKGVLEDEIALKHLDFLRREYAKMLQEM